MKKAELGLIGLAAMGQNLALNIAGKGFQIAVFNRTIETGRKFLRERAAQLPIQLGESVKEFVGLLERPRMILLMLKAGKPVDEIINQLLPLLLPGDLIADCGNSFFQDTERRAKELSARGLIFMGIGVSGGEQGALQGPSIMPGGALQGWEMLRRILEAISAKVKAVPCVTYLGPGGSGHFVKMVHNGIEYGDLQLIAESYHLLHRVRGLDHNALAKVFTKYNRGRLASYLMEITAEIFQAKDPQTGKPMLDLILDRAGQKGTGQWAANIALELAEPIPTITSAVEARNLSAKKAERLRAEKIFKSPKPPALQASLAEEMRDALYCSKLSLYSQGMALLRTGSNQFGYRLNLSDLAQIWKGGCIIRSALLDLIQKSFKKNPGLANLLLAPEVARAIKRGESNWRKVIRLAVGSGIPCPALSSALAYFDGYRTGRLPANLIQAQRDFFGAHTFERIDQPGNFHHQFKEGVKSKKGSDLDF